MRTLILFFSLDGNTAELVERIADGNLADLHPLVPRRPYTQIKGLKYFLGGMKVVFGTKPKLLHPLPDISSYDMLVLASPTWAGTFVPPFRTLFAKTAISGKNIILVATSSGGDASKTLSGLRDALPGNRILGEFSFLTPLRDEGKTNEQIRHIRRLLGEESLGKGRHTDRIDQ